MGRESVFYDGTCGLCHAAVRFAARRDPDGSRFRFAPLRGETAARELGEAVRRSLPDSVVVRTSDGEIKVRSDAVLHILRRIGGPWATLGAIAAAVPRPIRDFGYRAVAAIRRLLFAPPEGACPVVPDALRSRFEP